MAAASDLLQSHGLSKEAGLSTVSEPGAGLESLDWVQAGVSLHKLTTFGWGGRQTGWPFPAAFRRCKRRFQRATLAQVPITLVGAGSNLLISDDGIRGLVMCTRRVRKNRI